MKSLVRNPGVYIKVLELPLDPLGCSFLEAQLFLEPCSSLLWCLCVCYCHCPSRSHWSIPDWRWHPQDGLQVLFLCAVCFPVSVFITPVSCSVVHPSLQPGLYLANHADTFHRWCLLALSTANILSNNCFLKIFPSDFICVFFIPKRKRKCMPPQFEAWEKKMEIIDYSVCASFESINFWSGTCVHVRALSVGPWLAGRIRRAGAKTRWPEWDVQLHGWIYVWIVAGLTK